MLGRTEMQTSHRDVQVLIVDDQASFRRVARSVIELTPGFVVVGEADTGEAAVDAVCRVGGGMRERPDLVLMDVHLPGIDGLEASRRIVATCGTRAPTIFLLSTDDAADYMAEPPECGAAAYLTKAAFGSTRLGEAWADAIASRSGLTAADSSGTRP